MQASYFNYPGLDPTDPRLVSIARWAPKGFKHVRHYQKLAPWKDMKGLEWFQFNQPFPTNLQKVLYGNTTLEA
jgi:hypothetical protein